MSKVTLRTLEALLDSNITVIPVNSWSGGVEVLSLFDCWKSGSSMRFCGPRSYFSALEPSIGSNQVHIHSYICSHSFRWQDAHWNYHDPEALGVKAPIN